MLKKSGLSKVAQKGVTLVELSIALAIAAVVTVVGVQFASSALRETRIAGESARFNSVVMKSRAAFANYAVTDATNITTANAIRGNVFPADMLINGTTIQTAAAADLKNRWNGAVTITPDPTTGGKNVLNLSYAGIPQEDCVEFVSRVSPLAVYIGDTGYAKLAKQPTANNGVLNLNLLAVDLCAGANNTVVFGYTK